MLCIEGRTSPRDELWLLVRSRFCTEMGIAAENCHISFSALRAKARKRGDGLKVIVVTLTNAGQNSARPREKIKMILTEMCVNLEKNLIQKINNN
jgi:hypothetical protein